jgi:hypothetical protein
MDTTAAPTNIQISLNPASRDATIRKVENLCKRAATKGLDGGWQIAGTEIIAKTDGEGVTRYREVITLEGTPFAYNGWQFVAAVEWLEGKPFVSMLPGYDGDQIDRDALTHGHCDHCNTTRNRSKVYIVESADGRMQVGSSCVKDFIGHDVSAVLIYPEDDTNTENFGYWQPRALTVEALAVAIRIARKRGYRTQRNAERGKPSTGSLTAAFLFWDDQPAKDLRRDIGALTEDDNAEARTIIEWVANDFTGTGDYAENLRVAASLEVTTSKTLNTLVSALSAKGYAEQRAAEQVASTVTNERFAADGEKVTIDAEVSLVRYVDGAYGRFAYVTLVTATHQFKWKATGRDVPEQGTRVALTGTVKGLDEWNGAVSTLLMRCKFQTV